MRVMLQKHVYSMDGKIHKIGAVDVKVFPKPDKYMEPWAFHI